MRLMYASISQSLPRRCDLRSIAVQNTAQSIITVSLSAASHHAQHINTQLLLDTLRIAFSRGLTPMVHASSGAAGQATSLCSSRAMPMLLASPPTAPSTVFLGLTSVSLVRPRLRPTKYAPVSAATTHRMVPTVASRPTVQLLCSAARNCTEVARGGENCQQAS
jgi:hypothetical protein